MKNHVLIIKNITHEKPGLILESIEKYNINYDIIDLSKRVEFPKIENYDLIIIMGGPDSANDKSLKILEELKYIKKAFKRDIPILGICLGLQLMVKALGGEVYKNPGDEIGFHQNDEWQIIKLTEEGLRDTIFKEIKDNFVVFQLHGETVKLIDDITLLGIGKFCKNQIIKIRKKSYGFQFHFELTEDLLNNWIKVAPELKDINHKEMLNDFKTIKNDFKARGEKIFENYLRLLKFK